MRSLILCARRSVELQKCMRNLRVTGNALQNDRASSSNLFSSAAVSPQDGRSGKVFTVSYLVDSLGFTTKLAESISRKVSFADKGNPDSVLNLLKSYDFTDSQISTIIRTYPGLLIADAERSLAPKLKFLQSRGASTSELTEILSKVPNILGMRWEKAISRHYDFVKDIIEADKSSTKEKSCLHSLPQVNKLRNVSVLRELGVPQKLLFSMLFSYTGPVCGKDKFEKSLKKVVDMGFDPTSLRFVQALHTVYQLSDKTIQGKINVYKRLGFAVEDVWSMFKKCPSFLNFSEKKILNSIETFIGLGFTRDEFMMMVKCFPHCIARSSELVKKKTEFVVKQMNWPLKSVALFPQVLGYSMEKRIVPRCNVIKALIFKGLLRRSQLPPMPSVFVYTDQVFLNMYVLKHDDKQLVADLMAIFTKDRV